MSDTESVKTAALALPDKIDMLINNAGVGLSGASELLQTEKIKENLDINFSNVIQLTNLILPRMSKGGRIINISSACAIFPLPYRSIYCSAKAALNSYSFCLDMELKSCGIKVVCICPGDIKSGFSAHRVKVTDSSDRYGEKPSNAIEHIDKREDKRMSLDKCAKKIFSICVKGKKSFYIVGGKYKVFYFFSKILPTNLFLKLLQKFMG